MLDFDVAVRDFVLRFGMTAETISMSEIINSITPGTVIASL
jgi:hypothetical protein